MKTKDRFMTVQHSFSFQRGTIAILLQWFERMQMQSTGNSCIVRHLCEVTMIFLTERWKIVFYLVFPKLCWCFVMRANALLQGLQYRFLATFRRNDQWRRVNWYRTGGTLNGQWTHEHGSDLPSLRRVHTATRTRSSLVARSRRQLFYETWFVRVWVTAECFRRCSRRRSSSSTSCQGCPSCPKSWMHWRYMRCSGSKAASVAASCFDQWTCAAPCSFLHSQSDNDVICAHVTRRALTLASGKNSKEYIEVWIVQL